MIEKNIVIYKSQREFVENAAHELQTPLAVFQVKIDSLIQRPDVTKEQSEILGSLNDSVSRLNRLNKNLLLISKIENDNYTGTETILLTSYVKKNIDFFTEQAKSRNLIIKTELQEELEIKSNPVLTEIFISNLFLNAIKHNIPGGQIIITITNNKLVFSNTGQSHPLNTDTLFNRFSKANPAEQGTGLGLSIVKKIAELNKWRVSYSYSHHLHSFTVTF